MWLETVDADEENGWEDEVSCLISCSRHHDCHRYEDDEYQRIKKQTGEKCAEVVPKRRSSPIRRFPFNGIVVESSQLRPDGLPPKKRVDWNRDS